MTQNEWVTIAIALITLAGTLGVNLFTLGKVRAEAEEKRAAAKAMTDRTPSEVAGNMIDIAEDVVRMLQVQLDVLLAKISKCEESERELTASIDRLQTIHRDDVLQLGQLTAMNTQLVERTKVLVADLDRLKDENGQLVERVASLVVDLDRLKIMNAQLVERTIVLVEELDRLRAVNLQIADSNRSLLNQLNKETDNPTFADGDEP